MFICCKFFQSIRRFFCLSLEIDTERPYYMERLFEISQNENVYLNLNLGHVREYNEALYRKIICYPAVSFIFFLVIFGILVLTM